MIYRASQSAVVAPPISIWGIAHIWGILMVLATFVMEPMMPAHADNAHDVTLKILMAVHSILPNSGAR